MEDETDPNVQSDRTGITNISNMEQDQEEDEDQEVTGSFLDKVKSKFQGSPKSKSPKNKTASYIIQAIIVVGVVYIVMTEFFPEEHVEAPAPIITPRKKEVVVEKTTPEVAAKPEESPKIEESTEAPINLETPVDSPIEVTSIDQPSTDNAPEPSLPSEPIDLEGPMVKESPSEDMITDEGIKTSTEEDNLTDKILQDIEKQAKDNKEVETKKEYVAPPDYDYRGRGLVYNCLGKHWACVDAPSYKICEDNSSSTKALKKAKECYPFNVYETQKGCESVQNRMVSSGAKTDFCGEN
ncbi:MAG: hypothetical protein AB7I27_03760 [Bacteriovoracaceae bacterium]